MSALRRLRRPTADEVRWRSRVLLRTQRDRARWALARPRWRREALRAAVAPDIAAALEPDIARSDWHRVQEALVGRLRGRPGRFVLDPASAPVLRAAILARWPDAADDAAARGDRLLAGRYDLLGYRDLTFGDPTGAVDWHLDPVHRRRAPVRFWADVPYLDPDCGDHKIIWELNRHQHWLALGRALWLTGDPRYRRAMLDDLTGWLDANPPLTGINWASMLEIGFRSISWIWALHVLLGSAPAQHEGPWLVDLLVGLERQLAHVERHLSYYFSPNTHLTGEALALYVAGRALPELAGSARWADTGRAVLLGEIDRQIAADGGHAERSTHYHRYTLDFYLLALLVARVTGDAEAAARFGDAAHRLAVVMRALADDRGRMPLIGDDDGGMLWPVRGPEPAMIVPSLGVAATVLDRPELAPWPLAEEVYWVAWSCRPDSHNRREREGPAAASGPPEIRTTVLADTGYVVMRDGTGGHLIFDVGPHGYLNGGHAHADALAITLALEGRPLLIDPGTATYTMDRALRDRLRLGMSHNTVTVDGRSSAIPAGPFHWATRTDARLDAWRGNPRFGWAEGAHDGYGSVRHRRSVVGSSIGWLVVDEICGAGPHRADAHWHFDPAWTVQAQGPSCLVARHPDGAQVWLAHDGADVRLERGVRDSEGGWCAPIYGRLEPTWSARIGRTGDAPLVLATWVRAGAMAQPPVLERIGADADAAAAALAVRLRHDEHESIVLLRPGDVPGRTGRTCHAAGYRTDARLLCASRIGGRVVRLELADFTEAVATDGDGLDLVADDWISDLLVGVIGDRLDVWSAASLPRFEVRGPLVAGLTRIQLNGRDVPFRMYAADCILVVSPGEAGLRAGSATHRPSRRLSYG